MDVVSHHVKHVGIESTGRVIEPRNLYSCQEADVVHKTEGSIPDRQVMVAPGQGRGLRAGHVDTGLIQEHGRPVAFLQYGCRLGYSG